MAYASYPDVVPLPEAYYPQPPKALNDVKTCGKAVAGGGGYYQPPTLRDQAEKQIGYHREQADKYDRAAAFFRDNPALDEFVQLVRSGAIQF
jgi:hypothetical protein